jgi:hypothetical protein
MQNTSPFIRGWYLSRTQANSSTGGLSLSLLQPPEIWDFTIHPARFLECAVYEMAKLQDGRIVRGGGLGCQSCVI